MSQFKILIVDDHAAVQGSLRTLSSQPSDLAVCGRAVDGLEAVDKTRSLRPDVVLMDLTMPRMDGVAVTQIIRRQLPEVAAILISQDADAVRFQAADVDAYSYVSKTHLGFTSLPLIDRIEERKQPTFSDSEFRL